VVTAHPAKKTLRTSLDTPFYQGIFIFPWKNELIFLGKMKIPWKNGVPKLALSASLGTTFFHGFLFFHGIMN
jgi:hypothetical protein